MLVELGVSGIVLSIGSAARHPLPSTGSLESVPLLRRYYEMLRLPVARLASLRVSIGNTAFAEVAGSPRFLENPLVRALLFDPGGTAFASAYGGSGGAAFRAYE